MSDEALAAVLTVVALAALFIWVPALHLCATCSRRLLDRRSNIQAQAEQGERAEQRELA